MNTRGTVGTDGDTITADIPLTFRKRGGPNWWSRRTARRGRRGSGVDNAMVKALARAFRWRKMLGEGVHATLDDLARAKGVHSTYVSRVLRLTLVAPEVVEAILGGRQPVKMQLDELLDGFPLERERQSTLLAGNDRVI